MSFSILTSKYAILTVVNLKQERNWRNLKHKSFGLISRNEGNHAQINKMDRGVWLNPRDRHTKMCQTLHACT